MIEIKDKKDCNGCQACGDICPRHCISFQVDNEGFWYPTVDKEACINCGLCERVCPQINIGELKKKNQSKPRVFGCYNKNIVIRFDSTSGGIFLRWQIGCIKMEAMWVVPFLTKTGQ